MAPSSFLCLYARLECLHLVRQLYYTKALIELLIERPCAVLRSAMLAALRLFYITDVLA